MDALNGRFFGLPPFINSHLPKNKNKNRKRSGKSSNSKSDSTDVTGGNGHRFPLKQALTASALALTGDTIAQLRQRLIKIKTNNNNNNIVNNDNEIDVSLDESNNKDIMCNLLSDHDWLRALRMTSYGFLLYGPGSYAWYQYLDHCMPKKNVQNLLLKVLLNQVVLGPIVIGVVFAWNNLWLGKLSELPNKYQKDALPTLLFGFRFWIPVSLLNFWVVPLQARVAFMSTGSIFWNFFLSSTMSK